MLKKFLTACLCVVFLTSCNFYESKTEEPAVAIPIVEPTETVVEPSYGGTLKISMRKPTTLNPLLNQDVTVDNVLKLIFMQLVTLDQNLRPMPSLAEEINFASDGGSVLIKLRELNWSDGTPVTSEDLIFSLKTLESAPEKAVYKSAVRNINTYASVDSRTVKITYNQPFSGSEYLLCFPVISKNYYENEKNPTSSINMTPMGNYLYKFESYTNMKEMHLSVNTDYPLANPYIGNIDVLITSDALTDLGAFDQSLIDLVSTKLTDWGKYRGSKLTKIYEYVTTYYDFIGFNFNNPQLQNLQVRQAIAESLDLDKLAEDIYHGSAVRANSPISPESWLYEINVQKPVFDMENAKAKAAEILAEFEANSAPEPTAKPRATPTAVLEKRFVIIVNEENDERVKIADALEKSMAELGLPAVVEKLPFDEFEKRLADRKYDIFIGGYNLSVIPDLTFAFHSSQADSGSNLFAYKSARMDMLLSNAFNYSMANGYKSAMSDLQQFIAEDLPCISICFRKSVLLSDKQLYGDIRPSVGNIFENIENWYLAK